MEILEKDGLEKELLELIVNVCNITDPISEDFSLDDQLIGQDSPLGLDSLDAVEIVVAVEKQYNVRIGSQETTRKIVRSLRTLADYVRSQNEGYTAVSAM
ncbi:MAG: phosphopantetheine-binding protein [Syntrophobacterales bacterium]|jgi:acyl carrier protein|nr:phosphopantetheine-binding protein [Syntrophobacterales bacterium]